MNEQITIEVERVVTEAFRRAVEKLQSENEGLDFQDLQTTEEA